MDSYEEKAMADIRGFEEDFLFAELEVSITQFEKKMHRSSHANFQT